MTQQFPEYDNYIKAVILSANDVIASILLLSEDEGYAPLNIVSISLPYSARNYRDKNPEGKSLYQRGDLLTIRCTIKKAEKMRESEEFIKAMENLILDTCDEDDTRIDRMQTEEQIAKNWADLEKRDLAKRNASCSQRKSSEAEQCSK